MGLFTTYCGFIYNDFLSLPLKILGSCYKFSNGDKKYPGCFYSFGVDPVWYFSVQEILVLNSIKMKIAVIIGVTHMTLGLLQKGLNALYFRSF